MKKIILFLICIVNFAFAQITQLDNWKTKGNTFQTNTNYLGTNNSRSLIIKTNSTQVGKIDSVGKWTIGTGTVAANTSSLGILRVKQGSSWLDIGEQSAGFGSIWFSQTPSASNYGFLGNASSTYLNASGNIYLAIGGSGRTNLSATGFRIGSTTAASATLDVTGTMSVSSTATITGALSTGTVASSSYLYLNGGGNNSLRVGYSDFLFQPAVSTGGGIPLFDFRTPATYSHIASTNIPAFKVTGATRGFLSGAKALQYESYFTAPTYTATAATTITTASGLHVEKPIAGSNITITNNYGISTDGNLLLGSAGLTGGNTGTVAVLSDAVFPVNLNHIASNPADGTSYFLGNNAYLFSGSASSNIRIPYNCTLVGWDLSVVNTGGNGSAETATVSISGTTNYTLSTSISYAATAQSFTATGLSQNFTAGDVFSIKILTPTWVTNPLATFHGVTLWFVRRQ